MRLTPGRATCAGGRCMNPPLSNNGWTEPRAQEEWTQYWTTDIECKPTPGPPGPRITLKQLNHTLRAMSDSKARGLDGWRPSELYALPARAK